MKKTDMKYSDIHMHSNYSDGKGTLRGFVESAIRKDIRTIGFSDHSPVPMANCWSMKKKNLLSYIKETGRLKDEYSNSIEVLRGVELDYIDGVDVRAFMDYETCGFDYFIGSVHYVFSKILNNYYEVDGPSESFQYLIEKGFENNVDEFIERYYSSVRKMIIEYKPQVIAHIDLIKKNNEGGKYFDEAGDLYIGQVEETLAVVKKSGALLEINTGAISRGYTDKPYPSDYILRRCIEEGIGITLNSDAHEPGNICYKFNEMISYARTIGFKEICFLRDGIWTAFAL